MTIHLRKCCRSNLPVTKENTELRNILRYFDDPADYLPLYQSREFRNGLLIEIKGELINEEELELGVRYRESLYHNHDFFEMLYVARGSCVHWIDEQKEKLNEGDLPVFNLETVHKMRIDEESAVFEVLVGKEVFSRTFMELFGEQDPIFQFYIHSIYDISSRSCMVFRLMNKPEIRFFLDDMIETFYWKKRNYERQMQLDFTQLLTRLSNELFYLSYYTAGEESETVSVDEVLWHIHANYQSLSLQDLVEHFGYVKRTMMRYLKKHFNKSFKNIVQEYRLLNACTLLRRTDLSIEEICGEIGLADRSYPQQL